MSDQANNLRHRMLERARPEATRRAARPLWIVVAGGKGGVGATTVAIQLALAGKRRKTLLVDADPRGGDVALQFDIDDPCTLGDLLAGRRCLAEVTQEVADGLRVVPGVRAWDDFAGGGSAVIERLNEILGTTGGLSQFSSDENGTVPFATSQFSSDENGTVPLPMSVETVVFDLGTGRSRAICRLWQAADAAVMVTSDETSAVVAAHRAIRTLTNHGAATPVCLLVNKASAPELAESVYQRLAQAGRRFLGIRLENAGRFPVARPNPRGFASHGKRWMHPFAATALNACKAASQRHGAVGSGPRTSRSFQPALDSGVAVAQIGHME